MYSLFRDNVPAIVLNQWETTADYLDDDLLDGVMPVLFADNVHAAEAAICEAPLTAKRDLERLAKVLCPETLDLTQAEAIVRKPRLGEVLFWFKNLNLQRLFAEDSRLQSPEQDSPPGGYCGLLWQRRAEFCRN